MAPHDTDPEIVRWATAYPFGRPRESYLFRDGDAAPLDDAVAATAGRVPVIASGSNAAPAQLARKYGAVGGEVRIPVTRARVGGFDSVYNAHIAAYGSVPATLFPSPGTELETFITWLDEAQLAVMHETEQPGVNYHFAELGRLAVAVEGVGPLETAYAYVSVAGCLSHEGAPVSLAEVPARRRRFAALGQRAVQEAIRALIAPEADLESFIRENVADAAVRRRRCTLLARTARPFAHDPMRIVAVTGHGCPG